MNPSVPDDLIPDDLISAYFDGEATPDERQAVERVLESSSELRQLLDDTSKLSALLHSFPREAAPATLAANVEKQINSLALHATPAKPLKRTLRREWSAFAAGMMATMASLAVYVTMNPTANPPLDRTSSITDRSPASKSVAANGPLPTAVANHTALQYESTPPNPTATLNGIPATDFALSQPIADTVTEPSAVASPNGSASLATMRSAPAPALEPQTNGGSGDQNLIVSADQFLPPLEADLWESLQNGQVIVRQMVNPDNMVMVVELQVVDVPKGMEMLTLKLQTRSIGENDDQTALAYNDARPVPSTEDKNAKSTDAMFMIYVQAPGNELADTIREQMDQHPDIYRGLTPRPPIELPPDDLASLQEDARRHPQQTVANPNVPTDVDEANSEPEEVSAVGNLIANRYVNSQAPALETSASAKEAPKQHTSARGARAAMPLSVAQAPGKPSENESLRHRQQSRAENTADARALNVNKARQENGDPLWSYAAFRVATDHQPAATQQNTLLSQSPASNTSLMFNNGFRANSTVQGRQAPAGKLALSNLNLRDPRRMRMLIVLKPEQSIRQP
ncbi:anti-sigma factor family protein [Schlesneria paludicola]|uniref:anti-sigma factor family protein n=1 Tax=Schlesneria paludicola TaxID=360056 RepID=UPI00029AB9BD|nr:hypothetical protein [Schlesneria paludicola]